MNLLPHHHDKLDQLVKSSGVNRNSFFRKLIMSLTDTDVKKLMNR